MNNQSKNHLAYVIGQDEGSGAWNITWTISKEPGPLGDLARELASSLLSNLQSWENLTPAAAAIKAECVLQVMAARMNTHVAEAKAARIGPSAAWLSAWAPDIKPQEVINENQVKEA